MNKWQKGVLGNRVEEDEKILKRIKKAYQQAEKEINDKIASLLARTDTENLQSIIYQVEYQKSLKSQINGILDGLNANNFNDISEYLEKSYENGFIGALYDIHGQGIPLMFPINQEQVVRVLKNNSKLSKGLWGSLYDRNSALQNKLRAELSRGISQGHSYAQMAKRVSDELGVDYNKVSRIVRTESHRIANEAALDAQYKAKEKGADIVKQWDATLDGVTRPEHQELDGQIRELDKPFEVGGYTAHYPGGFGAPHLDINCRCALLQRAKWALDEDELDTLKERAKHFGLDKTDSFEEYKKQYLKAVESPEFKNPYFEKKISLTPDGKFYEGETPLGDVYEIDWDGTIPDGEELIIDAGTGEAIPKSALKKIKDGEKFDEEVWSINPDGSFSKGIVKDQAQYKLNLQNNKAYVLDADEIIADYAGTPFQADIEKKFEIFSEYFPESIQDEIWNYTQQGTSWHDPVKKALANNGYDGFYVASKTGQVDDILEIFDDSLIKKTKKSKLETLTDDLAKSQKKLNKIDNKTYSGIWKDDVSVSDYAAKKASIQAKKDWYNDQLANLDPSDVNYAKYKKYLDDLDEFEKLGKEYEKAYNKVKKIQDDLIKIKPKTDTNLVGSMFDADAYSQDRKNMAHWYTNANGGNKAADQAYRPKAGEVWRNASKAEKDAAYEYTRSYHKFNEPLRGIEYGTNKYLGVGNVDLDQIGVSYAGFKPGEVRKQIDALTSIIDKSAYDDDIWLQRGVRYSGMDKFFGVDPNDFFLSEPELAAKLLGTTPTEYGFMSTATAKGKGFSGDMILNIYAPRGTKMIYAEPFSAFGSGGKSWDGISSASYIGGESEMLLQRGTKFRVTKVEKSHGQWYVDLEVIDQSH